MNLFTILVVISSIFVVCHGQNEQVEKSFIEDLSTRIVGGELAEEGQFPHQVALFRDNRFSCGGSIVGKRHVLTAAHCVYDENDRIIPIKSLTVLAGTNKLSEGGEFFRVHRISPHLHYGNFTNDIALIKIKDEFEWDNFTQPIELNQHPVSPDTEVEISGWGRVGTDDDISFDLKFTTSHAIGENKCREATEIHHPGIVCLQSSDVEGVCFGDSGGPATANGKLVGVANFIIDGCGTAQPDGFASVSYFYDWIVRRIRE